MMRLPDTRSKASPKLLLGKMLPVGLAFIQHEIGLLAAKQPSASPTETQASSRGAHRGCRERTGGLRRTQVWALVILPSVMYD